MNAAEYMRTHGRSHVALLFQLWAEGVTVNKIAVRMGVAPSTVSRWVQHYHLPDRPPCQAEPPAPSPEDDAASLAGLALSPWVEERARVVREKHYLERRNERDENARSKAAAWRRGDYTPRGAHHERGGAA